VKLYGLKFVPFAKVEDHFRAGWVMSFPNAPMHHHYYGVELAWICPCPIPGLRTFVRSHRVPETPSPEDRNERAGA